MLRKKYTHHQRGPPVPVQYYFRCEKCGVYQVTEKTARKFLTRKLQKELDKSIRKGVEGAILTFLNGCPNCKPANPDAEVELSVFQPKVH
jgi:hypothetical protein